MSKIQKIAVFTSIRSEYGLLSPLLRMIENEEQFDLKLLVGGAHLKVEFGETIKQIIEDGFTIEARFDFLEDGNSVSFSTDSIGLLQIQIGKYFSANKPDLLIVLGDRYELLPVATAAILYQIPIAHISGGETTEGAIDNQIRHALTKLSHIHFPATEEYKNNLIKMGEEDWRICASGEPGLDEIINIQYIDKQSLYNDLKLDYNKKTICCTFHPQTIDNCINADFVKNILIEIVKKTDFQILTTAANFDNGGYEINEMLESLSKENDSIRYVKSLGQRRYYSFLKYADLMLGNSSSGLVEAQSFNLPVINVGNRQKGRLSNLNVINVEIDNNKIIEVVKEAVSEDFKAIYFGSPNIYGDGNACQKIIDFLKEIDKDVLFIKKDVFLMNVLKYIGGEYADNELNDFYSDKILLDKIFPKKINMKSRCFFETGTDSLAAIFIECCEKNSKVNFFIPINYCFETIERLKLKLSIYNIQLIISVYNNLSEIELQNQKFILINHYNCYLEIEIESIKFNSIIIEDFVHSPFEMSKFKGHYTLNSLRKFADIELSITYLNKKKINYENCISDYFRLKKEAQKDKTLFFETNNIDYEKSYLNGFSNANKKLFNNQIFLAQNSEIIN